jgi:hypothetical protein
MDSPFLQGTARQVSIQPVTVTKIQQVGRQAATAGNFIM